LPEVAKSEKEADGKERHMVAAALAEELGRSGAAKLPKERAVPHPCTPIDKQHTASSAAERISINIKALSPDHQNNNRRQYLIFTAKGEDF
jgi:hypothetical protein